MNYTHLTNEHRDTLRAERVLALEADHYRATLALAELHADAPAEQREAMSNELGELERRITAHSVADQPDPVADQSADTPAPEWPSVLATTNGSTPA